MKKAQEKKLDVAEMRMLRWMSGVTKLDRIRNERIKRDNECRRNIQESAGELKWYGHIEKRRRICGQESDGDGGGGEKKKRKTKEEVVR